MNAVMRRRVIMYIHHSNQKPPVDRTDLQWTLFNQRFHCKIRKKCVRLGTTACNMKNYDSDEKTDSAGIV